MIHEHDDNRESVFHERVSILKEQGYRGYSVTGRRNKWEGMEISAVNPEGRILKVHGETEEEAYTKMVDLIDQTLDD